MPKPQLRVVTVGHVDHGKSTLIGRLLHDTGNLLDGKADELRAISERRGVPFEWSFVLDALQSERDQAITIDTTRIWMHLGEREIVLIDAPGHEEFLRNMVTGASDADAALLVVDAAEGVSEQTRRHALLLELIGIRQVVVAINKMDRVGHKRNAYEAVRAELEPLLARIGVAPTAVVPIAARDGDNIAAQSKAMPWYTGPTIVETLAAMEPIRRHDGAELRMAVQGVVRRGTDRIVVGRIEAGSLGVGDEVVLSPGARIARVKSLESWPGPAKGRAQAGESVGFTLDLPLFIERGDIVSNAAAMPGSTTLFRARLLWLGRRPLEVRDRLRMRIGTRLAHVQVEALERGVDITTLEPHDATNAQRNDVAEVVFRSRESLALDTIDEHPGLARLILIDGLEIVAGGTILASFPSTDPSHIVPVGHLLNREARAARNGHCGAVIWMTGLPAAGKSTIAMQLERRLHERGVQSYVLDGDNLRTGLCRDLGFSDRDRSENIRRVGEVATLFGDAGQVAIAAFISPSRADRDVARRSAGDLFHEVFVKADVSVCEARDPKGHYAQARAGEIPGFTGITGEYEEPLAPNLVLDTEHLSLDDAVSTLFHYVMEQIIAVPSPARSFAVH
ncbi:MAG: adenylyl-sulfate kinase [Candidatus Eremiobacteraeota bacterium]|nr:adenylyl-sulfate kinase [Candidatus Eremiobacteraeota bacterium]MBC5803956.1 adenylyl-sulfate kinase [Candidatus Eremiobacteraeota bacterium]MBC5824948.1 adenylyl-sulfate kinase [Candidatus Eremiobacteraeota bacterium]